MSRVAIPFPESGATSAKAKSLQGFLSGAAFGCLWLFVFSVPWENMSLIDGLGTMGRMTGMIAFGVGVLAFADVPKLHKINAPQVLMMAFFCWRTLTFLWTMDEDQTLREIGTMVQFTGMIWLLNQYARSRGRQVLLLQAYVLGTIVSGAGTVYQYLSGSVADGMYLRYAAQGFNPGDLALIFVLSIPMSLYLMTQRKGCASPWINRLHLGLTTVAILLNAARGVLLAAVPTVMMAPKAIGRMTSKQVLGLVVAGAIGVVAVVSVVPETSWTRLSTIADEVRYGDLNVRKDIWKAGIEMLRRRPFIGVGAGAYDTSVQSIMGTAWVAHNTFLSVLVEEGVIGFALFGLMLCSLWIRNLKVDPLERRLWMVMLMVWAVGVMELTWESRKPTWLVFGLMSVAPVTEIRRPPSIRLRGYEPVRG
jgi:O-antigen ligase